MFMRFRGGGVGHLGTRYLDSSLKVDNHESGDDDIGEDPGILGERVGGREPSDEEEEEDEDKEDNSEDKEDDKDDDDKDDDEILDEEGFAEL